jgi:lycopene cyclase domain-containing protein
LSQFAYLGVLGAVIVGSFWLEFVVRTRVFRRWRRLLFTLLPVMVIFVVWDLYAIAERHWWFAEDFTTGVVFPGQLPLEEALFFVIIPIAAILTLEAVRAVRRWPAGDEPPGAVRDGVRVSDL